MDEKKNKHTRNPSQLSPDTGLQLDVGYLQATHCALHTVGSQQVLARILFTSDGLFSGFLGAD